MAGMEEIFDEDDLDELVIGNFGKPVVITFYTGWFDYSVDYVEQFEILQEVSPLSVPVIFVKCDAEKVPSVAKRFKVEQVPCIIVTETLNEQLLRLDNIPPINAIEDLEKITKQFKQDFESQEVLMRQKVTSLLEVPGMIMFITGTPQIPLCKFTTQLVNILNQYNVDYRYYDIEVDLPMRHWVRKISSWPTFPMIFLDGKLVGGLDVIKQRLASNSITLPLTSDPQTRLQLILNQNKSILFIDGQYVENGNNSNLSEQTISTIQLLQSTGIAFNVFNLLIDTTLREYLNSNEQSVPPVFYAGNKLVGNSSTIKSLVEKHQLLQLVPGSEWRLNGGQKVQYLLQQQDVLVFIEGTPDNTQTATSKDIITLLKDQSIAYQFYNVSADKDVTVSLLSSSTCPELPQLYFKSQLIGGIEIVKNLANSGELKQKLSN